MKKIVVIFIFLNVFLNGYAQSEKHADDAGKIVLNVYIPQQADKMPEIGKSMLANKLAQIVTQNGLAGNGLNQKFIITANVVVLDKNLTATAPPMIALSLEVSIYIGDGVEGVKFAGTSLIVKGVGTNETKAYISALKNINVTNPELQVFVESGKAKIIQYYNTHCNFILSEVQGLVNQNKFDEALYKLTSVPQVCKDCYIKSVNAVGPIYKKEIDNAGQVKLAQARNVWAANQNIEGANAASAIISEINPMSTAYKDVKVFVEQIAKRIKELDKRQWNYQLKQQQQTDDIIQASKDVGMAYAVNQPQALSYNIVGWW